MPKLSRSGQRSAAKESDTKIIGSYHNFACTPGNDFLITLADKVRLKVPLISISMRLDGSSLTFAAGQGSPVPGQMPINDLHNMLALMQQSTGIHFGNRWIAVWSHIYRSFAANY